MDLVKAINATVEEEIDKKISASSFVGMMIDESTDVAVYKKLVVYVRVIHKAKPEVLFLNSLDLPNGIADTIVTALKQLKALSRFLV